MTRSAFPPAPRATWRCRSPRTASPRCRSATRCPADAGTVDPGRRPARVDAAPGAGRDPDPDHHRRQSGAAARRASRLQRAGGRRLLADGPRRDGPGLFGVDDGRVVRPRRGRARPRSPGPFGRGRLLAAQLPSARPRAEHRGGLGDRRRRHACSRPARSRRSPSAQAAGRGHRPAARRRTTCSATLWLVDRDPAGARVHVVHGRHVRAGRRAAASPVADVAAFAVGRDGTRLVGRASAAPRDRLRGRPTCCAPPRGPGPGRPPRAPARRPPDDRGRIVDLAWRDARRPRRCSAGRPGELAGRLRVRPTAHRGDAPSGAVRPVVSGRRGRRWSWSPGHRPAAAPGRRPASCSGSTRDGSLARASAHGVRAPTYAG